MTHSDAVTPEAVVVLPPDLHAAGVARQFVHDHSDHLPAAMIDDAQLLVSEIVTNAARHGHGDITLRVRLVPPGIGIAVSDDGEGTPEVAATDLESTSGRGMLIVAALASAWGVTAHEPPPGKTVWFDIRPEPDRTD